MTNLEREIRVTISIIEADPNAIPRLKAQALELKKTLETLGGASPKGTDAEAQYKKIADQLSKQEQLTLKTAVAQQKLAELVAKTEAAQSKAAESATKANAAAEKAASDSKKRSDDESSRLQKVADAAERKAKAEAAAADRAARASEKASQEAAKAAAARDVEIQGTEAAARRLAEVIEKGATATKEAGKARGQQTQGDIVAIKALENEISVLTKLQKEANDAASRYAINNALRAARVELDAAKQPLKTLAEQTAEASNASRKLGVELGTQGLASQINSLQGSVEKLTGSSGLGAAAGQLAGLAEAAGPVGVTIAAVTAALVGVAGGEKILADRASDANEQLSRLEESTGAAAETIVTLQQALQQSGGDASNAANILVKLKETFDKFKEGDEKTTGALERLVGGPDVLARIKSSDDLLKAMAANFGNITDEGQRTTDLIEAFGNKGVKAIGGVLSSLGEIGESSKALGLLFTDKQRADLAAYDAASDKLAATFGGIALQIGASVAPAFTKAIEEIQAFIESLNLSGDEAKGLAANFAEAFISVGQAVLDLKPAFEAVVSGVGAVSSAFNVLTGNSDAAVKNSGDLSETLKSLAVNVESAGKLVAFLAARAQVLAEALKYVFDLATAGIQAVAPLVDALFAKLQLLADVVKAVGAGLSEFGTQIQKEFESFSKTVSEALEAVTVVAKGMASTVATAMQPLLLILEGVQTAFKSVFNLLKGGASEALDVFGRGLDTLINDKLANLGKQFPFLSSAIEKYKESLAKSREAHAEFGGAVQKVDEAAKLTASSVSAVTGAFNKQAADAEALAESVNKLTKEYTDLASANKGSFEQAKTRTSATADASADPVAARVAAAKELVALANEQADAEIAAAKRVYDAKLANQNLSIAEFKKAGDELLKADTAANEKRLEAQKSLEAASASLRSRTLNDTLTQLDLSLKEQTNAINENERVRTVNHQEAEDARYAATVRRLEQERTLLLGQLGEENVSADERIKINERLTQVDAQLSDERLNHQTANTAARVEDEEEAISKIVAAQDLLKAQTDIRIAQAKDYGATASEIALIERQGLEYELLGIKEIISLKEREGGKEEDLLRLKKERLRIEEAIRRLQLGGPPSGAGGAAPGADKPASGDPFSFGAVDIYAPFAPKGNDNSQVSNSQGLGGAINAIGQTAAASLQAIAAATAENIGKILKDAQSQFQDAAHGFAFAPTQIAGLLQYQFEKAFDVLQAANRKQAELQAAAQAKADAEAKAAAEERARTLSDIATRTADQQSSIEKRRSDTLSNLREAEAQEASDYAQSRLDEQNKLAQSEIDLAQKLADNLSAIRARHAAEDVETERQRLQSIQDLREQTADANASSARARIKTASDFRKELRDLDAQLKTLSADPKADPKAIEGIKARQKEIAELQKAEDEKKRAEDEKNAEIEAALRSGKSKEEIDALVAAANEKFRLRQQEIDDLLEARKDGDKEELEELERFYAAERVRITAQLSQKLAYIAQEKAAKAAARAQELADAQTDYNKQLADLRKANADRLNELEKAHSDRMKQFARQRAEAQTAYQNSLSDLYKALQKSLSDSKISWDEYARFVKDTLGGIAPPVPPGNTNGTPPATTGPSNSSGTNTNGTGGEPGAGQQTTGSQTGPSSTSNNQDPATAPKGGNSTGGPTQQPGGGNLANSERDTNAFIAHANTFVRGEGFPTLKNALHNLEQAAKGYRSGQVDVPPSITQADYSRALAALKSFWSLRNAWEYFRRHRLTASRVIDVIGQMVEAGFVSASDAKPYLDAAKKFINDLGKNTTGGVPKFDDVGKSASTGDDGAAGLRAEGSGPSDSDIREGGLTAPITLGGDPFAGLQAPPGPTPIPGPGGAGKTNPFTGPIKPPRKQNRITKGATGTVPPPVEKPDITGSQGRPYNEQEAINFVLGAFAEVKAGQRDTSYASSKINEWWRTQVPDADKTKAHRVVRAAQFKLTAYAHGTKTALDSFTPEDIRLYGDGINFNTGPDAPTSQTTSTPPGGPDFASLSTGDQQALMTATAQSLPALNLTASPQYSTGFLDGSKPSPRALPPAVRSIQSPDGGGLTINQIIGEGLDPEGFRRVAEAEYNRQKGLQNQTIERMTRGKA